MRYIVTLFFVVPAVVGCSPATLNGEFSSVDVPEDPSEEVSPEDVRVFVDRSPAGFSRLGGNPSVEAGFEHVVLGRVRVLHGAGRCDVGPRLTRQAVLAQLRQRAAQAGGNAIVYAHSRIQDEMSVGELCRLRDVDTRGYGWGWVVRMHDLAGGEDVEVSAEDPEDEMADSDTGDAAAADAEVDSAASGSEAMESAEDPTGEEADAVSEETVSDDTSEEPA